MRERRGRFEIHGIVNIIKPYWYFNLIATNGKVIATSELYRSKAGCLRGIAAVQRVAAKAEIKIVRS